MDVAKRRKPQSKKKPRTFHGFDREDSPVGIKIELSNTSYPNPTHFTTQLFQKKGRRLCRPLLFN
jgi:hypothetical protein